MPLFYQHNINENTRLGIWHIEESESFFLRKVPLKKDVSHPHKRLQHLAGRWLLPVLFNDFPLEEIVIADTRKPFLENEMYHFSISHCGDFAAAIVSSGNRVGVDIEFITEKINKITHKFLQHEEYESAIQKWHALSSITTPFLLQTILWSSKEAIYKWYSLGEVDFREHIHFCDISKNDGQQDWLLPFEFRKNEPVDLSIHARTFNDLVLAWVLT
ncbi:MAG: 4-phosphopantetheinyl transferase [Bacteroidetes bacterium]|nr:MAG: 4-phosphopantetheinyl transferase [Bacteroidota bacterium]